MNGGSYSASLVIGRPRTAPSRARTAPEECPNTEAAPSASATKAPRSSTSRSTAYVAASPLSPRPRRSNVMTVNRCDRSPAMGAPADRSLKAPPTRMTDGPRPTRSNAIGVSSFECTVSMATGSYRASVTHGHPDRASVSSPSARTQPEPPYQRRDDDHQAAGPGRRGPARRRGQDLRGDRAGDRRPDGGGGRGRSGRRPAGGRRGGSGIRRGPLAEDLRHGPGARAAPGLDVGSGAAGGPGETRGPKRRKADPRRPRRDRDRCRHPRVLGRGGEQDLRRDRANPGSGARRDPPKARARVRSDYAL